MLTANSESDIILQVEVLRRGSPTWGPEEASDTITSFAPDIHSPPAATALAVSPITTPGPFFMLEADAAPLSLLCLMRWPEG